MLLTTANAKTIKGEPLGYLTGILYLAPHRQSGVMNVCAHASAGCAAACLFSAGRGRFTAVKKARLRRTVAFFESPKDFVESLAKDVETIVRRAAKTGLIPAIRLNGTSDLPWENLGGHERVSLIKRFPTVQFYDYTKNKARMLAFCEGKMPANYHLTFSRSETNEKDCQAVLKAGGNVAAVFSTRRKGELPKIHGRRMVIDADLHDLRFLDPEGVYCGLRAKGDAVKDQSGFVLLAA